MAKKTHLEWLMERVDYDAPDCLIWPFARDHQGRGLLSVGNKKIRRAHRVMCEIVNGPPPSEKHQAAHECGNGHLGCIHPKHLIWKTQSGNTIDRIRHGRPLGNPGGNRSLFTANQIEELKTDIAAGISVMEMARKFGRPRSVIQFWKRKFRNDPNAPIRAAKMAA